ncbi:TonB family protein [Lysobacter sp. F60174L2]|uniref:TonB family protein n=1 Tax=Lysobacter sp. F60174L2 TaxID=3459295 RepID=UPI00403DC8B6
MIVNSQARQSRRLPAVSKLSLVLAMGLVLAACNNDQAAPEGAAPASTTAVAPAEAPVIAAEDAVSDKVNALSAEQLREAARKAYGDNRLYAPAEDNAVEYYLALRDKSPGDASVSSALTDLLPMTVIATEQSINRGDFAEAQRLAALLEKAEPQHPALARLRTNIETQQKAAAERAAQQIVTAEEQAAAQAELERKRLAEQKRQQEQAARELAAREAADKDAAAQAAAEKEAADKAAADAAAAEQRRAAAAAAAAAKPTAADLRPLAMPGPQYPREALRAGQSGEVLVEYTVGTDGSVTSARVVRSNPGRVFDRAALDAVQNWRFQPISEPVTTRRAIGFSPGR